MHDSNEIETRYHHETIGMGLFATGTDINISLLKYDPKHHRKVNHKQCQKHLSLWLIMRFHYLGLPNPGSLFLNNQPWRKFFLGQFMVHLTGVFRVIFKCEIFISVPVTKSLYPKLLREEMSTPRIRINSSLTVASRVIILSEIFKFDLLRSLLSAICLVIFKTSQRVAVLICIMKDTLMMNYASLSCSN